MVTKPGVADSKRRTRKARSWAKIKSAFSSALAVCLVIALAAPMSGFALGGPSSEPNNSLSASENVKIHLFNYGSDINSVAGGILGFSGDTGDDDTTSEKETDYGHSSRDVVDTSVLSTGKPEMSPLIGDDGYPYVVDSVIGEHEAANKELSGSLKYLFDVDQDYIVLGEGDAPVEGDPNDYDPTAIGGSDYVSKHFAVSNEGNEGTGLFWLDESGYLVFDSADRRAYFDESTGKFELYDYAVRPFYGNATFRGQGHFLPFNDDFSTAVQITDEDGNLTDDEAVLAAAHLQGSFKQTMLDYAAANPLLAKVTNNLWALAEQVEATTQAERAKQADYYYGMSVEFDFYMPKGGSVAGEPMVFDFLGDDDVWVYIDGVLVLNIGGTHNPMRGYIDFSTGEVQQPPVDSVVGTDELEATTLRDIFEACGKYTDEEIDAMFNGETFVNFSEHELKFYYMERGAGSANCRLRYNMPILPDGNVTVKKAIEGTLSESTENVEYGFQVYDENHRLVPGASYAVMHTDGTVTENLETDANGGFSLKANEIASFQLTSDVSYYIVELDSEYAIASGCVTTDGGVVTESEDPNQSADFEVMPDKQVSVVFTNTLNGSLTIGKTVTGEESDEAREWAFRVVLSGDALAELIEPGLASFDLTCKTGSDTTSVTFAKEEGEGYVGTIVLKHGLTAVFEQIPAYVTYSVTEIGAASAGDINSEGYATTIEGDAEGTVRPGIASSVAFTNDYADSVEVAFSGIKLLFANGEEALLADYPFDFQFELEPVGEAKMPEGKTALTAVPDEESGELDFGTIEYTYADLGEHTYIVSEIEGNNASIEYDKPYEVTVTVARDADINELSCEVEYTTLEGEEAEALLFVNEYTTPELTSFQIEAEKVLEGAELEAGMFSFALEAADEVSPMPEGADGGVLTATNEANGAVMFSDIWVADADADALGKGLVDEITYSYVVSEVNLGEDHYTYDEREYVAEVTIGKNEGNQLEVREIAYLLDGGAVDAISFENVYDPPLPDPGLPSTGDGAPVAPLLLTVALTIGVMAVASKKRLQQK